MLLVRQHNGDDAILRSLADEFVLFTTSSLFPHLESNVKPGRKNNPRINKQARELAFNIFYGLDVINDLGHILMKEKTVEFPTFKCSDCHKEYTTMKDLRRHITERHTMRRYLCPVTKCSKTTSRLCGLYRHLIGVHHYEEEKARSMANVRKNKKKKKKTNQ